MRLSRICYSCFSSVHICIWLYSMQTVHRCQRNYTLFPLFEEYLSCLHMQRFLMSNFSLSFWCCSVLKSRLGSKMCCKNISLPGFQWMGGLAESFCLMCCYMGHSSYLELGICLGCMYYKIALKFNKSNTKIQSSLGLITAVFIV